MRQSAKKKPLNQYIVSAQLDAVSHAKMTRLLKETGMSKSRLFRILIMGARINHTTRMEDNQSSPKEDEGS